MAHRLITLLETLSSQQFRTVVLLALGLETWQIADLMQTSEQSVLTCLNDSLRRTGCRDAQELSVRALEECDHDLYDESRLKREMATLQDAAQKILTRSGFSPQLALAN